MDEPHEIRLKRLKLRSIRRGIREMDLILGAFVAAELAGMDAAALDAYESLLQEPDQELLAWVTGQSAPPATHRALVGKLREVALAAGRQGFQEGFGGI